MKFPADRTETFVVNEYDIKAIWKTYIYWAFWVGIAFFGVYPLCNWISAQRNDIHTLYLHRELAIPFIPQFFWAYVSMYILFLLPPFFLSVSQLVLLGKRIIAGTLISALIFLLVPSQLGFERITPEGFYAPLYARIFSLDLPYNMAPSLHIVYSAFILFSIYAATDKTLLRFLVFLWLIVIVLSTLLVHQHHLIDIVMALAIVWLVNNKIIKRTGNG